MVSSLYIFLLKFKTKMHIPYREIDHGNFDEEWLPHYGANDWWYVTGYLSDIKNPESLFFLPIHCNQSEAS